MKEIKSLMVKNTFLWESTYSDANMTFFSLISTNLLMPAPKQYKYKPRILPADDIPEALGSRADFYKQSECNYFLVEALLLQSSISTYYSCLFLFFSVWYI